LMVPAVDRHFACCKHHNDLAFCLANRHMWTPIANACVTLFGICNKMPNLDSN
jgi:hypothetical protein